MQDLVAAPAPTDFSSNIPLSSKGALCLPHIGSHCQKNNNSVFFCLVSAVVTVVSAVPGSGTGPTPSASYLNLLSVSASSPQNSTDILVDAVPRMRRRQRKHTAGMEPDCLDSP